MFNELNHIRTVKDGINTKELTFKPLSDFVGKTIKVDGFFFTVGKYGRQVVVVGNGYNINMPKRAERTFDAIANNQYMLNAVLNGKLEIINIEKKETKSEAGFTTLYELHDVE